MEWSIDRVEYTKPSLGDDKIRIILGRTRLALSCDWFSLVWFVDLPMGHSIANMMHEGMNWIASNRIDILPPRAK